MPLNHVPLSRNLVNLLLERLQSMNEDSLGGWTASEARSDLKILSGPLINKLHSIFSDDLVDRENETLRERVVELERRLHDQNDEITCLRATLADALRRISSLEAGKGGCGGVHMQTIR